jgi:hypothetical protein
VDKFRKLKSCGGHDFLNPIVSFSQHVPWLTRLHFLPSRI